MVRCMYKCCPLDKSQGVKYYNGGACTMNIPTVEQAQGFKYLEMATNKRNRGGDIYGLCSA